MKVQIQVGGTELLLTPKQVEALFALLSDCEVLETRWRGTGNGFFGRDMDQEIAFKLFDPTSHARAVQIWSDKELDKWRTIIELRNNQPKEK